ncbi:MAG: MFS transporter [Clostridiales bacterium]|nr:MFS transporter [Clostridiales bacterium]
MEQNVENVQTVQAPPLAANGKLTKKEKNWILYDVANSAYTLLATALLAFYFDFLSPSESLTTVWGSVNVIVTIIAVILCPIMGTYADFSQKRKVFAIFASIGIVGCTLLSIFSAMKSLAFAGILFLVVYIITEVGYTSANVFYDSMLSDITTDEKMHKVSANGYAWGYIGSCIPFIVCLVLYILGDMVLVTKVDGIVTDKPFLGIAYTLCCLVTAVWWFIFTLPLYKSYQQTNFMPKPEKPVKETFVRLGSIFKELAKNKKALFFLIAYFFYIDGVHTIIKMAMSIGKDLQFENFGTVKLVIALFVTQIVAFPCAIIFGKLSSKYKSNKLLVACIAAYTAIGILAVFLRQEWQFWAMAVGVGMFQGGVQAMSRSYFTKIIPSEKTGEYFGIYDIFGKSAAIVGVGLISLLSGFFPLAERFSIFNIALLPLPILFLVGLVFFLLSMKIPADPNSKLAEEERTKL